MLMEEVTVVTVEVQDEELVKMRTYVPLLAAAQLGEPRDPVDFATYYGVPLFKFVWGGRWEDVGALTQHVPQGASRLKLKLRVGWEAIRLSRCSCSSCHCLLRRIRVKESHGLYRIGFNVEVRELLCFHGIAGLHKLHTSIMISLSPLHSTQATCQWATLGWGRSSFAQSVVHSGLTTFDR